MRVHEMSITVFCIHGNHETRPKSLSYYRESEWPGGTVYYEEDFPDILFAKDGEIYDFHDTDGNNISALVIGGAYSVDKFYRILNNCG